MAKKSHKMLKLWILKNANLDKIWKVDKNVPKIRPKVSKEKVWLSFFMLIKCEYLGQESKIFLSKCQQLRSFQKNLWGDGTWNRWIVDKKISVFLFTSFYRDVFTMEVPTSEMFLLELEIDWSSSNSRRFLCHVKISVKYLLIISLRLYSTKSRTIKSSSLVKVIKPKKVNFSLLNTACKTIISECSFEQFSYFLRYFCWLK